MRVAASLAVLAASWNGWASDNGHAGRRHVTACLESPAGSAAEAGTSSVWENARTLATEIFAGIDVKLDWKVDSRSCAAQGGIRILIQNLTPPGRLPGALGYATPSEGHYVVVFYDRVLKSVPPENLQFLLGHVLAHEITHVLEGAIRHSDSGLMKEHWSEADLSRMAWKPLPFAEEDISRIRSALAPHIRTPQ